MWPPKSWFCRKGCERVFYVHVPFGAVKRHSSTAVVDRLRPIMEVTAALERFWPGRTTRCEPLTGGFTNHNFRVDVDGGSYVLRIGGNGPR